MLSEALTGSRKPEQAIGRQLAANVDSSSAASTPSR